MKTLLLSVGLAAALSACAVTETPERSVMTSKMDAVKTDTIDVVSAHNFKTTDMKLKTAIESRGLKIFTVVNHGEGARSVGKDIGKSKLYIFGNPKSGTPLMMDNPKMGLELPMKALVYQGEGGSVHILRNNMTELTADYRVTERDQLIDKISETLSQIVREAAGN